MSAKRLEVFGPKPKLFFSLSKRSEREARLKDCRKNENTRNSTNELLAVHRPTDARQARFFHFFREYAGYCLYHHRQLTSFSLFAGEATLELESPRSKMAQKKSGKKAAVPSAEREADNAMLTTAAPDDVPSFDQSMLESQPSPTVEQYLKETTSRLFSIPLGFFTSRQEFRAWGAEKLSDPAVQPLPEKRRRPPTSFPSVLPGYPEESYMMFATSEMPQYRSAAPPGGVRLRHAVVPQNPSMVPREASPAETSRKNLVAPIGYDWKELQS